MSNQLTGTFELRMNQLVGWVRDVYSSDTEGVWIDVCRRGIVVASCPATAQPAQPEQRRFDFRVAIDGLCTGAELVREDVYVIAHDTNGNSGRLRLDGAAQLELIRAYLGLPVEVILDLDFSRGGNAAPYLGSGWSEVEADFTWAVGHDSFIYLDAPPDPGTYLIRMTAGGLIHKPAVSAQELSFHVNATHVGSFVFTEWHTQFQEIKFSHEVFSGEVRTTLRLHHPDAARPCDLGGNPDTRWLALNFKRLTLVRLLPVISAETSMAT